MLALDKEYGKRLQAIAEAIQASEELSRYLDEEEEADYTALREKYEPGIGEIHHEVAAKDPLQLVAFEEALLEDSFEGLYLPRILGYSVLRGEVDDHFRYKRPQSHFRNVLLAICNSANFDILKKRIGQTIQVGFALSSDIWITNLINSIDNRKIRYYLLGQKLDKYHDPVARRTGYVRYARQFVSENYQTVDFPTNLTEFQQIFSALKNFLLYRAGLEGADNASIIPHIKELVNNKDLWNTVEHLQLLGIYGGFWELQDWFKKDGQAAFTSVRKNLDEVEEHWFSFLLERFQSKTPPMATTDHQWSEIVDRSVKDELSPYFDLMLNLHEKGIEDQEAQDAIRQFHNQREGLSTINECVRQTVLQYFGAAIKSLEPAQYTEYFEVTKLFPVYMDMFANQQFNQSLKAFSMSFVKKCLKVYTDKRGKDYQDIKKFVSTTFVDLGFLTEKETVELFKTRRKRKVS
jgi:hypothetical protein